MANSYFSRSTATSIVIANMIGTGVFTSLGFQLVDIDSAFVILLLWALGGLLAFCGALCYAELGAALPRSGGEYNFLGRIYHPAAGFISGWISSTIGFAAPTALAAITAATYLNTVVESAPVKLVAVVLVVVVTAVHLGSRRQGGGFQFLMTAVKVFLIIAFVLAAWIFVEAPQALHWGPQASDLGLMGTGGFAVALIYVNYAYTGWNAATYLAGEVETPQRNLPFILMVGTLLVAGLYLLLHVMFLTVAPMDAMRGQLEIGYVVARYAFGELGSQGVAVMLSVLLVSTVSAMVLAGPRALQVIGQDFKVLSVLGRENRHGIPHVAILTQAAFTIILIVTSSFEAILVFASFTLALNTLLTILGVGVLRRKQPDVPRPFEVPWYPLPVIIYVGITLWTLVYVGIERPVEAAFAAGLIASGWLFYLVSKDRVTGEEYKQS
ncbi:MAG: amino acid permease [Pseudomonadota bacterium]